MFVNIKGTEKAVKDLEEANKLIKEATSILYRIPTQIEIEVTECSREKESTDSNETE